MRLLFLTGSLVHGGAERHSITLVNRLAERGHECHAAYVKNDPSQLERLRGAQSTSCLHARRYLDRRAWSALAALMRRLRPTVVVAANPYALMYASLARGRSGLRVPLAVTFHTTIVSGAKGWAKMLYYRPLFWRAQCLVFVCEAQRRYWQRRLVSGRRNAVLYNGVDTELWKASATERAVVRSALGYAQGDLVIGMSAVLRAEKNHLQLVEAIARLRAAGIPARALMIGDGPMRAAVEARARSLRVADAVAITGYQQEVRPLLAACDAAALCSTAVETFSLAALEAMALGLPVVHAELGGAAEMIRPGSEGFLFPARDTGALVERLGALADPGLRARLGAQARATVVARFSERSMVDGYETLLGDIETARSKHERIRKPAGAH